MATNLGTMLVVDDDAVSRMLLAGSLEAQGHTVVTACGGNEALAILRDRSFDLVLLDLLMPEVDGFHVLRAIKRDEQLRHLPVVVISCSEDMEKAIRCIEMGATDFISKPCDIVLLRARVNASLESKRFRDKEQEYLHQIRLAHGILEQRVRERTVQLIDANQQLQREIEERKQTERALRESEERIRNLVENVNDIIYTLSPDGVITSLNAEFEVITGWPREGWIGRYFIEIVHPDDRDNALEEYAMVLRGKSRPPIELRIRSISGEYVLGEFKTTPVKKDEEVVGGFGIARDITRKVAMQAEAVRLGQLASLGELAAGVAHEVNNPINTIINCAQILINEGNLEGDRREMAGFIIKEGKRISRIVGSLLSFARERKEEKRPVRIIEIIEDTLSLTGAQIRKEGIDLQVNVADELPAIPANPQQIEQVFLNLIGNARYALKEKYPGGHPEKVLQITAEPLTIDHRSYVRVEFYDRGTGIPAGVLSKVLNPFFTTKAQGGGTGLGLSISHGIILDHGGRLSLESVEGEYTRVNVDLPA